MREEVVEAYDYLIKEGTLRLIEKACHNHFTVEDANEALTFRFFELDHPFVSWVLWKLGKRPRWTSPW